MLATLGIHFYFIKVKEEEVSSFRILFTSDQSYNRNADIEFWMAQDGMFLFEDVNYFDK